MTNKEDWGCSRPYWTTHKYKPNPTNKPTSVLSKAYHLICKIAERVIPDWSIPSTPWDHGQREGLEKNL